MVSSCTGESTGGVVKWGLRGRSRILSARAERRTPPLPPQRLEHTRNGACCGRCYKRAPWCDANCATRQCERRLQPNCTLGLSHSQEQQPKTTVPCYNLATPTYTESPTAMTGLPASTVRRDAYAIEPHAKARNAAISMHYMISTKV